VLDIQTNSLRELGGAQAGKSKLMFATFSPDGSKVAFVCDQNLYVQDLRTFEIVALTNNGSETLINGTFDWVYEEELQLRKGFHWSPDSKHLAYWQIGKIIFWIIRRKIFETHSNFFSYRPI
jgi:dipeptidyl-peptidase-4